MELSRYETASDAAEAEPADVPGAESIDRPEAVPADEWKVTYDDAVLAVAFNVTMLYTRNYNEAQIGSLIASVYDYHADYETNSQLIESAAFDYLYE